MCVQDLLLEMLLAAQCVPDTPPLLVQLGSSVFERAGILVSSSDTRKQQLVSVISSRSQMAAGEGDLYGLTAQAYRFGANGMLQLLGGDCHEASSMLSLSLQALDHLWKKMQTSDTRLVEAEWIVAQLAVAAALSHVQCMEFVAPEHVPEECIEILEDIKCTQGNRPEYYVVRAFSCVPPVASG